MAESNRACVWVGRRQLEVQQRPIPALGDHDVLVKVMSTGICGSDLHNWESAAVSRQLVLGHESAGVIERVGAAVTAITVRQRVAVEPGAPCRACEFCTRGQPNICASLQYCGMDPTDGTLSQYAVVHAARAVPIPDSISWEEAGAIQPLAVAVQLGRRAALNAHQTLAIL